MAPEKAPAFQFYPKDFLSDGNQGEMSLQETGAYVRLLCRCWLEKSIPDDAGRAANLAGTTRGQMVKMWPAIRRCFRPAEDGRLVHPRLESEREKQAEYRRRQSDKGKASAATRHQPEPQPNSNHGSTGRQPDSQPKPNSPISCLLSPISDLPSPISNLPSTSAGKNTYPRLSARRVSDAAFDAFWVAYPRKKAKHDAIKAWLKLRPDTAMLSAILQAVETQRHSDDWLKENGRWIPYPATWLNAGRWMDETDAPTDSLSETARYNLRSSEEAKRLILEADARRKANGHLG